MPETADNRTLLQKLNDAVHRLPRLEIVTAVGPVDLSFTPDGHHATRLRGEAKVMSTTINLLEGDVTTLIDPAYTTGDLQGLREFHHQREQQGSQIIRDNVAALLAIFDLSKRLGEGDGGSKP